MRPPQSQKVIKCNGADRTGSYLVAAEGLEEGAHGAQVAAEETGDVDGGYKHGHAEGELDPGDQALNFTPV